MANNGLGFFAGGFMNAFNAARDQKTRKEEREKELKARTTLFELQMKRMNEEMEANKQAASAREELFSRLSGSHPLSAAPGTSIEDPRGPARLTDLLADPEGAMLLLRSGVVKPEHLIPKQAEIPAQVALLQALRDDPSLAKIDAARRAAAAPSTTINLDNQGLSKPPTGYFRPDPTKAGLQIEPGGPVQVDTELKKRELDNALALYETAKQGLLTGLERTATGPLLGKLPAITSGQQTAQGSIAAMAPVLKQLFRAAGEGVFTDKDQQLLIDMIPTRETNPEARESMLQNIDAIIRAKLGLAPLAGGGGEIDFSELPD